MSDTARLPWFWSGLGVVSGLGSGLTYTDGTRWTSGDLAREPAVAGRGELPDDSPTGEDLVDSAGEENSRADRLRRGMFEEGQDLVDVVDNNANDVHDIFAPPPTSSYESTPTAGPHFSAQQHPGADVGTGATVLLVLGLTIDRAAKWAVGHLEKHPEGD